MNPDPVPPVRPLLTHVIADEPLRREAGIRIGQQLPQDVTRQKTHMNFAWFGPNPRSNAIGLG